MIVMPTEQFRALAEALANLEPDWFAAKPDANTMKIALGEFGDIWPDSIIDANDRARETYLLAKSLYRALKYSQSLPKHLRNLAEECAMADLLRDRFTSFAEQVHDEDKALAATNLATFDFLRNPEARPL